MGNLKKLSERAAKYTAQTRKSSSLKKNSFEREMVKQQHCCFLIIFICEDRSFFELVLAMVLQSE